MSALGAAGTVGGLATLSTGSLKQGLLSGLGAYGGANLYSGLVNAGSAATSDAAANAAIDQKVKEAAVESAGQQAITPQAIEAAANQQVAQQAAMEAAKQQAADTSVTAALSNPELAYRGAGDIVTGGGIEALAANMPGDTGLLANAGMAATPFIAEAAQEQQQDNDLDEVKAPISYIRPYELQRNVRSGEGLSAKYQKGQDTSQRRWFDDAWKEGTPYEAPGPEYKKMAEGGMTSFPYGESVIRMAGGGLGSLGGYSDGGRMLKGPGDGMSDSIPATINGKQPARLANDEFVVPADVVAHLGNGSSDAGAKQLYKMMDRVRQARTGKKKQAPAIKAPRYMPA